MYKNILQSLTNFHFKKAMILAPFPIFFWAWVLCITFWIESASVHTVPTEVIQKSFSQIDFTDIHYMQDDQNDVQVTMNAPKAQYSSKNEEFILDNPSLKWHKASDSHIISASAFKGNFYAKKSASDLPSAFEYIILSGSATFSRDKIRIDSETMIFDNDKRFFVFPGPFTFIKDKDKPRQYSKMYYDPVENACVQIDDLYDDNPSIKQILKKGGF